MGHYKENMRTRFTWISRLFCAFMVVWMCPMVAWIWFDRQLWERCQLGLRGILSNIRLWDLNIDRDVASVVWEIAWRCYTATGSRESFHRKQHKSFQPSFCTFHRCLWAGKLGWKGGWESNAVKAAHHDWRNPSSIKSCTIPITQYKIGPHTHTHTYILYNIAHTHIYII